MWYETAPEKADLTIYQDSLNRYERLTKERERELIAEAQAGSREAEDTLVRANLKFVIKLCNQNVRLRFFKSVPLDDMIQYGTIGLLTAIRRFDLARTTRLLTYAKPYIRAKIQLAAPDHVTIRMCPRGDAEVAKYHAPIGLFCDALVAHEANGSAHVDEPTNNIVDYREEDPGVAVVEGDQKQREKRKMQDWLRCCEPREAEAIKRRFGLGVPRESQIKIGRRLGVSECQAKYLQVRGLNKMRQLAANWRNNVA